jgi:predicted Fe-Mo cluster-binding NifX family protein
LKSHLTADAAEAAVPCTAAGKEMIMKIAFSTSGKDLDALVCSRFGRADGFLIYDTDTDEYTVVENQQNVNAPQGAGIQAAQAVVKAGASALVTGHCGPKAFTVFAASSIRVYHSDEVPISEALQAWRRDALAEMHAADVDGHWV